MARILLPPRPVSWLLQIETGVGKTEVAIGATANAVKAGMSVVYAVPRHNLGDELSRRFAAAGVAAQAYRGYEAADPASEDKSMCLDLAALRDVRQVGL